jgi:hypothetical protein
LLADEAGSQLTGTGGCNLSDGQRLASATNIRDLRRTGAIEPDESPVPRLGEELRIHEGSQQRITHVALEAPQALRLRRRQSKSGHFYVFALNPLKHFVDTHGFVSKQIVFMESFPVLYSKQPAYRVQRLAPAITIRPGPGW